MRGPLLLCYFYSLPKIMTASRAALSLTILFTLLLSACAAPPPTPIRPSSNLTNLPLITGRPMSLEEIHSSGILVVGTSITEPFEFHDPQTRELVGFDVEVAEYIAQKMGVQIQWIEMPFASLIPSLQERQVQMAIAALYITPGRTEMVAFSTPYIETGLVMVAHPDLASKLHSVEGLAGLRVGVKIGATGASLANSLVANGIPLIIHEYKETSDSLMDLMVGRLDLVINDYLNTVDFINKNQAELKIITSLNGETQFFSNASLGIAVHSQDTQLLEAINQALEEMHADGTYDRLYEKWLKPANDTQ